MKRARIASDATAAAQRVVIDVGGTKITTTAATIDRCSYLSGMLDLGEDDPSTPLEIFVDRDAGTFEKMLRLLRQQPQVGGLVPRDPETCAQLIAEADFCGWDYFLEHVKVTAFYNTWTYESFLPDTEPFRLRQEGESRRDYGVYRTEHMRAHKEACAGIRAKFLRKDEAYAIMQFDEMYGSIGEALGKGILPDAYLNKPAPTPPAAKILQLLPLDATTWFLVGHAEDIKYMEDPALQHPRFRHMRENITQPGFVRRVAFFALVEGRGGHRWTEPVLHVSVNDQQEWMDDQAGDGQRGPFLWATYSQADLENFTGGAERRTLLASEWLRHAVYNRHGHELLAERDFWTHLLVSDLPPAEYGFSAGREGIDFVPEPVQFQLPVAQGQAVPPIAAPQE
jgi:hypothetical protein